MSSVPEIHRDHPPFSGDDTVCVKCLNAGATTAYMKYGECTHSPFNEIIGFVLHERLHRECRRCGYTWDEALAVPEGSSHGDADEG